MLHVFTGLELHHNLQHLRGSVLILVGLLLELLVLFLKGHRLGKLELDFLQLFFLLVELHRIGHLVI